MKTIELVRCEDYFLDKIPTYKMIGKYVKLLKQLLIRGMFVPCDLESNVLEKPKDFDKWLNCDYYTEVKTEWIKECVKYQLALDRVIFEGFEVDKSFKGWGCVTNGSVRLHFIKQKITIETIGQFSYSVSVKTISDLTGYGLKIKMK